MSIATQIPISSKLEEDLNLTAALSLNEGDFEELELGEGIVAQGLKNSLAPGYQSAVDQAVHEIVSRSSL